MEQVKPKTVEEVREAVLCARINLDNLALMAPFLYQNAIFKLVRHQLNCALVDDESGLVLA
jgi:hypothetical protein